MTKVLRCGDISMNCDFEVRAEEEILQRAAEHAHIAHHMQDIPEEVVAKVRAAIREE